MKENSIAGWQATLKLGFEAGPTKTLLEQRRHEGPLVVQRPFYPEGDVCHVYLLHPPGGIVATDRLDLSIDVKAEAQALLTTPGATKIYRSEDKQAIVNTQIRIDPSAGFEWLPQESILFEGANLKSCIHINLEADARFIGWDIVALGRPAADENFDYGQAELAWQIDRQQQPLFLEKMLINAESLAANWGLNGDACFGTLIMTPASEDHLESVRVMTVEHSSVAVTLIDDVLICRAKAGHCRLVREYFESVRTRLRQHINGHKAYSPRVWAT